ncbi:phage major tail tube protein [Campylobacter pinnipediorum]|uniref:phage major tail tube protein n=1 Tax=Campylobacter pinnipediorum TaxID=1965231 RepID=UPI000995854D|nr:phage major tail tube protein [Campylobacter pinnipediorum]AQW83312.1 phage tail tube protein FII [Campylobacter pinnipediorum subsp. pinnipediorum]OPA75443.1 phage tail protein [Campylobacter pinnipediorum subsp. pinnipediorum]
MVRRQIPQIVQEANVYVDGQGYLGVTKKLKLPTIEFETLETKGALSAEYSMGVLKATEIEFTINKIDKNEFNALGINVFKNRVPLLFKASIFESGKEKKAPLSLAITGDFKSYEITELESGKELEITAKMSAHFIDLKIDNTQLILKDVENMICVVGGVDYMADVRANLGE